MNIRRRRWGIGLLVLAFVATVGGSWRVVQTWRNSLEEKAFQERLATWGGGSRPLHNDSGSFSRVRGVLGDDLYGMIAGSRGRAVGVIQPDASKEQLADLLTRQPISSVLAGGAKQLDDDWVLGLKNPANMEMLILDDTGVTDRSVETIARMTNLGSLGIVNTAVSDEAVERLRCLPNLHELHVGGPNIRAIRLIELQILDAKGQPTSRQGPLIRARGRIASNGLPGHPENARVMIHPDGDPPPWKTVPYGWNAHRVAMGMLTEEKPGIWTFDIPVPNVPSGSSSVEVWIDHVPVACPKLVRYRLEPFILNLSPPKPGQDRDADVEPGPPR